MQCDIKCARCRAALSDYGFICLKNMVRRNNMWFVMCHKCHTLHYLSKLNDAPLPALKQPNSILPQLPPDKPKTIPCQTGI